MAAKSSDCTVSVYRQTTPNIISVYLNILQCKSDCKKLDHCQYYRIYMYIIIQTGYYNPFGWLVPTCLDRLDESMNVKYGP